jgi:hypothetical protein
MTLTPSQIEVLARFDGWQVEHFPEYASTYYKKDGLSLLDYKFKEEVAPHLTSPATLIEIRLKLGKDFKIGEGILLWTMYYDLGELILNAQYTEAAIKASEIILKLQP